MVSEFLDRKDDRKMGEKRGESGRKGMESVTERREKKRMEDQWDGEEPLSSGPQAMLPIVVGPLVALHVDPNSCTHVTQLQLLDLVSYVASCWCVGLAGRCYGLLAWAAVVGVTMAWAAMA
ncbi:hypothetical protein U1Q18_021023 [Sarracenia purpurea var. burkii]